MELQERQTQKVRTNQGNMMFSAKGFLRTENVINFHFFAKLEIEYGQKNYTNQS